MSRRFAKLTVFNKLNYFRIFVNSNQALQKSTLSEAHSSASYETSATSQLPQRTQRCSLNLARVSHLNNTVPYCSPSRFNYNL